MQRIRLTTLLPVGQLALAVLLLTIGQNLQVQDKFEAQPPPIATTLCLTLNAPAFLASLPVTWLIVALHFRPPPSAILSPIDEIPFLIMVVALWYLVARWLSGINNRGERGGVPMSLAELLGSIFALSVGAFLLYAVVEPLWLSWMYYQSLANLAIGIVELLWAIAILFFLGRALLSNLRRKRLDSSRVSQ
jgi:hypothetical protein